METAVLSEFYLKGIERKKRQIPLFQSKESKKKREKRKSERFPYSRLLLNKGMFIRHMQENTEDRNLF